MPNIPIPCTNCLRFHYGLCWEAPKQCFQCGGFNHIERYCPRGRRIPTDRRGPLPGTLPWCEMHGVNNDSELKRKVLDALKMSPGCSIWVDECCIYQGNKIHFTREEPRERGRLLADRISRARSRSPARERAWKRSRSSSRRPRSHLQRYDEYLACSNARPPSPRPNERYRSRTPILRRSPSPYQRLPRQERTRSYASGSNAVDIGPRRNQTRATSFNGRHLQPDLSRPPKPTQMPMLLVKGCASTRIQSSTGLVATTPAAPKNAPLGEVSANILRSTISATTKPVSQKTRSNTTTLPENKKVVAHNTIANIGAQLSQLPNQNEPLIEDPYFVLGLSEGATEVE